MQHFHDLKGIFTKLKSVLCEDGWLVCDIANFMEVVAKVDHCFWLRMETAKRVFNLRDEWLESTSRSAGLLDRSTL